MKCWPGSVACVAMSALVVKCWPGSAACVAMSALVIWQAHWGRCASLENGVP